MTLLLFLLAAIMSNNSVAAAAAAAAASETSSEKLSSVRKKNIETTSSRRFDNAEPPSFFDTTTTSSSSSTKIGIVLPDYYTAVDKAPSATTTKKKPRSLTGDSSTGLQCSSPDEVYYKADFNLHTYYSPYWTCSQSEWDQVGALLDYHFDQFVAHNDILGPIEMVPTGPSCLGRRRRLVVEQEVITNTNQTSPNNETANNNNIPIQNDRKLQQQQPQNDPNHRQLQGYGWTGGGSCEFCGGDDNGDGRRQLTATNNSPITIVLRTDDYPDEIAFTIRKASDDSIVYTSPRYSSANQKYTQTVHLQAGVTYKFRATDGYGDGWCCSNGWGYAKVYEGTSTSNTRLVNLNYNFGSAETFIFDAPLVSSVAYRTSAQACTGTTQYTTTTSSSSSCGNNGIGNGNGNGNGNGGCSSYSSPTTSTACTAFTIESAFPQIEHDVSNYISYYIQQAYHWNNNHCLVGTYPTVWVDLTPTTKGGSQTYC